MQLGFLTLNTEERSKATRVLQAIKDQQAIDELGIGRLRDAFSNTMFPGMSTLQKHAKYFAVLPSLYYEVEQGSYNRVQDVRRKVIELEIKLTRQLLNWANSTNDVTNANGITGSDAISLAEKDYTKYVKYDPSYIYWNGMVTFGMVKTPGNIYQLLLERTKSRGQEKQDRDKDSGKDQLFSTCGEKYDFEKGNLLSMELTTKEARFIRDKIIRSKESEDSMLAYILDRKLTVCSDFEKLGTCISDYGFNTKYGEVYELSVIFSHFVEILRIRMQLILLSSRESEQVKEWQNRFDDVFNNYKKDLTRDNIERILKYFENRVTEKYLLEFCQKASALLEYNKWNELDLLLKNREKKVKGEKRCKLLNYQRYSDFNFNTAGLTYRWELVYVMIKEIRKGLGEWQEI